MRSAVALAISALALGCGLIAEEAPPTPDAAVDAPKCMDVRDLGYDVKTEYPDGPVPTLTRSNIEPDRGPYIMIHRAVYGSGADPSRIRRKSIELTPFGHIGAARVDDTHALHTVEYQTVPDGIASGARLETVCGETETFWFEVVVVDKTHVALVGHRGARTVVEEYEPPPPL